MGPSEIKLPKLNFECEIKDKKLNLYLMGGPEDIIKGLRKKNIPIGLEPAIGGVRHPVAQVPVEHINVYNNLEDIMGMAIKEFRGKLVSALLSPIEFEYCVKDINCDYYNKGISKSDCF